MVNFVCGSNGGLIIELEIYEKELLCFLERTS